jgi:hypothetical protein
MKEKKENNSQNIMFMGIRIWVGEAAWQEVVWFQVGYSYNLAFK